jgi:hypothetical protein
MYDPAYKADRHIDELQGRIQKLRGVLDDIRDRLKRLVPVPRTIVQLGRVLQGIGLRVSENPAFGGVCLCHAPDSAHYSGHAIDVNADANEPSTLDRVAAWVRRYVPGATVLWRVTGHYDHLHAEMT